MARKLACTVERVVAHGDRVYSVWLRPEQPAPVFRAGQFLHLAIDPYDPTRFWPESRAFSIASAPASRELLRLSYAARGPFTTRMETELVEGRRVWVKMPYGEFVVDDRRDVVLFAGGTGITAFTAFLEGLLAPRNDVRAERARERSIVVAYGARTPELLIYRALLDRCVREVAFVTALYFVEQGEAGRGEGAFESGRVSVAAVLPRVPRPGEAHYYVSGPPVMLESVTGDLRHAGVAQEAIHVDVWA